MNNFTICYNLFTSTTVSKKIMTTHSDGMKLNSLFEKFVLLFVMLVLVTGTAIGQNYEQLISAGKSTTSGTSLTVNLNKNTTAGNTLIAIISTRGTIADRVTGISGIGDWTRVTQAANSDGNTTEIWFASNIQNASKTVTINLVSGLYAAAVVMEYSGEWILDQYANNTGNSTTASTGTTATTSSANELWIGAIGVSNSGYSPSGFINSFTSVANVSSGSKKASDNTRLYTLEKIVNYRGEAYTGARFDKYWELDWSGAIATFRKPVLPADAGIISGPSDVCQGATSVTYTVPAIARATSYEWTYIGTGAVLNGIANTVTTSANSVTVNFNTTATTGFLNVKGCNVDGAGKVSPNFAVLVNSSTPGPINGIITNENCPDDKDGSIKLKLPTALKFDGAIPGVTKDVNNRDGNTTYNDGVNLKSSFLNNLKAFTVEGWVNANVPLGNVSLFGQNDVIEIGFKNNKIELYTEASKTSCLTDIDYPTDGKWHHVACTGDKYGMKIYIDGIKQCDLAYTNQVTNYGTSLNTVRIGRQVYDNADLQPFTGQIVKVGFWNYAKTTDEVVALAGGGFHDYTSAETGLIAGYNFYETTGDVTLEPVSNPAATAVVIPAGTLVNSPEWNDLYNYTWTKTDGGTYNGAITKNIKLIERGVYNVAVTSKFACGSTMASFTVAGIDNYWTGAVSTNWGDAGNWTCGIPREGKDVVFATPTNNPSKPAVRDLELLDASHVIGNLRNETSLAVIIPSDRALTVQGTVYGSETDPNKIRINAVADKPNGSLMFTRPDLNPAVKATVQMYTRGYKGDQWSWYDPVSQQTNSGYYRWQFFGVPVKSDDILYNNMSLWGSYIRKYDETKNLNSYYQKWTTVGNNDALIPFAGYEITQAAPKTISFQGDLITGDQTLTLTKSTGTGSLNYGSGYNIFGNSFAAAIDISKIIFPNSGIEKTIYLYNTGSLADWGGNDTKTNAGRYFAIPQNVSSPIGMEIPSMQGFLLKNAANGATVTIPYNSTTSSVAANTTQQKVKRAAGTSKDLSYMTLDVTGQNGADRVWLFSQPGTSRDFDNGWDGEKIMITNNVSLFAAEESGNYQVNAVDDLDGTYLAFKSGEGADYSLTINKSNLSGYASLYLTDLATGDEIDLSSADSLTYSFTASNTEAFDRRFKLSRISKVTTGNEEADKVFLMIYSVDKNIKIQNPTNENGLVEVYDTAGRLRLTDVFNSNSLTEIKTSLPAGTYLVKLKSVGISQSKTILILP